MRVPAAFVGHTSALLSNQGLPGLRQFRRSLGAASFSAAPQQCRSGYVKMLAASDWLISSSAALDANVDPDLLMQLAGCAMLVGSGKYFQDKEEDGGVPEDLWLEESGTKRDVTAKQAEVEVDLYRDTWVRYFGYFNEVGEAFRPVVPVQIVNFSYLVAFTYILADSYSQGKKVICSQTGKWRRASIIASIDSLLFQIMASVVFPSFTINRWVTFVGALLHQIPDRPEYLDYIPTASGLVIIPLVCGPLDVLTHRLLDGTFRAANKAILEKS